MLQYTVKVLSTFTIMLTTAVGCSINCIEVVSRSMSSCWSQVLAATSAVWLQQPSPQSAARSKFVKMIITVPVTESIIGTEPGSRSSPQCHVNARRKHCANDTTHSSEPGCWVELFNFDTDVHQCTHYALKWYFHLKLGCWSANSFDTWRII